MSVASPPADLDQVRFAFRLGWAVAELRGRYRPDLFEDPLPGDAVAFKRPEHELPLASERGNPETRIELLKVAQGLSAALKLSERRSVSRALGRVANLAYQLNKAGADVEGDWDALADAFFKLDAQIQDALAVPASQAAAYQLGRGLAETYWALYPQRPAEEMGSWACVLGDARRETLVRLAARLSAYIGPDVLAAVTGPLAAWVTLGSEADGREQPGVRLELYKQGLMWRDLVRGERQPEDLPQPKAKDVWSQLSLYKDVFFALRVPLLLGLVAAAGLVAGAALLASGSSHSGWSTALTILGGLGLTSASLYTRAKANLISVLASLRETLQLERVRRAADLCPPDPKLLPAAARPWWRRALIRLGTRLVKAGTG